MQTHVLMMVAFKELSQLCQSLIWWLKTARRNFYKSVLVQIYSDYAHRSMASFSWHI